MSEFADKHIIAFVVKGPIEPDTREHPTRNTIVDVQVSCTKEEAAEVTSAVLKLLAGAPA